MRHSDPKMLEQYPKDTLRHDKISPALYLGMTETMAYVKARGSDIKIPVLFQIAGRERIVSRPETETFFKTIGSKQKQLIVYENSYHEIFNELEAKRAFEDVKIWLENKNFMPATLKPLQSL